MSGFQGLVAEGHSLVQTFLRLRHLVACNVFVVLYIGADGEIDDGLVDTCHTDHAIATGHRSAKGLYGHPSLETHFALQTLVL